MLTSVQSATAYVSERLHLAEWMKSGEMVEGGVGGVWTCFIIQYNL